MRTLAHCMTAIGLLMAAAGARAQANDNWVNRTAIVLPFAVNQTQMNLATVESTDPAPPCKPSLAPAAAQTLWYGYTTGAAAEYLTLRVPNNTVDAIVSVYTGSPATGFRIASGGCGSLANDNQLSIAGLRLAPNTDYSIEVAALTPVNSGQVLMLSVTSSIVYQVTKTADSNDGACDADCSLREAIGASNAIAGAVLIPAGTYPITIPGANETMNATGGFDVLRGMGIYGAGMGQTILDANGSDRVLTLDPAAPGNNYVSFALGDLTLTRGNATVSMTQTHGGGALLLDANTDYFGLERIATTASHTTTTGGGMTLNSGGTLRDCIIANNSSDYFGGGGLYLGTDDAHSIEISGSTISGNSINDQAGGAGGGIYAAANLRIVNSTISGNHAIGYGGGIMMEGNGSLHLASSTVVHNSAQTNPNRFDTGAGVYLSVSSPSTIVNSILAYNTAANPDDAPDCALFSSTVATSYNLVKSAGGTCVFAGSGDVSGVDPLLAPTLAANGGPTLTHALLNGTAALDSGDPTGCKDATGALLAIDQRGSGFPRVSNGRCDKGAVEGIILIFRDGFE